MSGPEQAPTNAAVLELKHEQVVVKEAYGFLDEKRLLLAAELLRQLRLYQKSNRKLLDLHAEAKEAIQSALMHHGLNGLQVYPNASLDGAELSQTRRNLMGVTLVETGLSAEGISDLHAAPANPSGKAERCLRLFRDMLVQSAALAGISRNLYR